MVVDDDPLILKLCSIILEKHDIAHITFSDSIKALDYTVESDIKLILLDIRLPGINGAELCKELRKKTNSDTRIIALTAHVMPEDRADLIENGFDEVLTKPFKENELLKQIGIEPTDVIKTQSQKKSAENLHILREMTMGDDELFQTILIQFLQETKDDVNALQENMKHLDVKNIRERVHKLAGRIGQVGADKISQRLRSIEDDISEGKSINNLAERIYSSINEVEKLVEDIEEDISDEKDKVLK
jgi:CheY-like chemotaxis protein